MSKLQKLMLLALVILFGNTRIHAQKSQSETIDASGLHHLLIQSDAIFQVHIATHERPEIQIVTRIEGETFESTLIHTKQEGETLVVTTGRTPDFIPIDDKLAAHKVLSIDMEVLMPAGMDLSVFSQLASVTGQGDFRTVRIHLGRGGCRLEPFRFRESATIETISGTIEIATPVTTVQAITRNGKLSVAAPFEEGNQLWLASIHGNISVKESE